MKEKKILPGWCPIPVYYHRWNRAHKGAFLKGLYANLNGVAFDDDPYIDKRNYMNRITWSRAFSIAWRDGWRYAKKYKPK